MACAGGSISPITTGARVWRVAGAGPRDKHRASKDTVRPSSSIRTLLPLFTVSSAVSEWSPTWSWRYSTRTGCRSPGASTPVRGVTSITPCSTMKRWCASTSLSGSPSSTQFSISTSTSLRSSSFQSHGSAPVLHSSMYTHVASAPSTATPSPAATAAMGRKARADTRLPSAPPLRCKVPSTADGSCASCALSAFTDSCRHSVGLATPAHATSVTHSVGKSAAAVITTHGGGSSPSMVAPMERPSRGEDVAAANEVDIRLWLVLLPIPGSDTVWHTTLKPTSARVRPVNDTLIGLHARALIIPVGSSNITSASAALDSSSNTTSMR
mmetsp:Transcript_34345/g.84137  ORF Transcript_34345/g.84137 Transcript_34345/m.84137 type:complete len:326 (-) Transcript_34345:200-1177(-)